MTTLLSHEQPGWGWPTGNEVNAMTCLEAALYLRDRGRFVLPLVPGGKKPYIEWSVGKGFPVGYVPSEADVRNWWRKWPEAELGMRTDGLWVLDVDFDAGKAVDGFDSLKMLRSRVGPLPPTRTALTPRGGHQRFYALPSGAERGEDVKQGADFLGLRGLDTRIHTSGIVALPPSRGRRWRRFATPVAPLPAYYLALYGVKARKPLRAEPVEVAGVTTGSAYWEKASGGIAEDFEVQAAKRGRTNSVYWAGTKAGYVVARGAVAQEEAVAFVVALGVAAGVDAAVAEHEAARGVEWALRQKGR